ncbi:MAG TPA: hypothetical protein VI432_01940 [Candidatus Paceibacterota bacterium]
MKQFIKKNIVIILAFSLPVLFILIIFLTTFLPSVFISTDYNFIYATCAEGTDYYCGNYLQKLYSIQDERLVVNQVDVDKLVKDLYGEYPPRSGVAYSSRIFLHDTKSNESKEIEIKEAETLNLNSLLTSPDGVTVSSDYDSGGGFFPFFESGSSYGYYLTKGKNKSRLNLVNDDERYYYKDSFRFIGWVIPGRNK